MAYSGENEDFSWPMSGQDGPDFEWEHVPIEIPVPIEILPISPEDHKGEEGIIPSVKGIQLEGEVKGEVTDDTEKLRSFEKYNPTPEELKGLPDKKFLDPIFQKHRD